MGKNSIANRTMKALKRNSDIRLALLFGSAAAGTMNSASDIDIAIALHSGIMSVETKIDLSVELEKRLSKTVDIIDLLSAEGLILCEAVSGEVLIEEETLRSSLSIKAMDFRENLFPAVLEAQRDALKDWINE